MTEQCGNCKYWRNPEPHLCVDDRHACMRFPPVVIVDSFVPKEGGGAGRAVYPGTLNGDWCGEWAGQNTGKL